MSTRRRERSNRMTMERVFKGATVDEVWELWTTKEGIESWWGPEGFSVTVHRLDLRPEGELVYAMKAAAPEMVAFLKQQGMPTVTEHRLVFTEVVRFQRLAYFTLADFVPGVAPYEIATVVELQPCAEGVRMTLSFDRMHDEEWTRRAVMGHESELGKLERVLASRTASAEGT